MKKLFAILALVGVMTSCKDKKKDEKKMNETAVPSTTESTTPTTTDVTELSGVTGEMPSFSDPEIQKFVKDYTEFVTTYAGAYKTKDMSKVAMLTPKVAEWSSRSMSVAQKLAANPEDATKFNAYMKSLGEQLSEAMKMK